MNECDKEGLEALVAGECTADEAKSLTAHAMSCPACRGELAALREDQARFVARARRTAAASEAENIATWQRVARALTPSQRVTKTRSALSTIGGLAVAAAAALVLGLRFMSGSLVHTPAESKVAVASVRPARATTTESPPTPLHGSLVVPLRELVNDKSWVMAATDAPAVRIKINGGNVTVRGGTARQAKLSVRLGENGNDAINDDWRLSLNESDGKSVSVVLECARTHCGAAPELELDLDVPAPSVLDVESVSADVTATNIAGRQRVRTVSGEVELSGSANVEVHTTSGNIELTGGGGTTTIATVSGEVDLTGACGKGCTTTITTVSGDVKLDTEDTGSFVLRYETVSGDRSGNLADDAHARELRVGGGEGSVHVKTVSGDLDVGR